MRGDFEECVTQKQFSEEGSTVQISYFQKIGLKAIDRAATAGTREVSECRASFGKFFVKDPSETLDRTEQGFLVQIY